MHSNRKEKKPRILIVGGVAGGASCAARSRRLSEEAEIIIFERGSYVSFASCGLPYYVGKIIKKQDNLLVATPELFRDRFEIDVRLRSEVLAVNREKQEIEVKNLETGSVYREHYDALVLATGTKPNIPPIPNINIPGVFTLRTIEDSENIKNWIKDRKVKEAAVIGGGYIGLETTENMVNLGLSVTIIEMLPQVMAALDMEMAAKIQENLKAKGVKLHLGDGISRFDEESEKGCIIITTSSGAKFECGVILLATGTRPETTLAQQAGLEIGKLGGIRVNDRMQTSDARIWAVGDAIEVKNILTDDWCMVPLAGPASRQGRIAANNIAGRESAFRGAQGTSICEVLGITGASTGLSEKILMRSADKSQYEKVYVHPNNHANYYPGATSISIKLIFSTEDGKILGAQAVGEKGVDKCIDVFAIAIQKGATVFDLEEAELCYSPQYGSAKDAVNVACMAAANILRGDSPVTHWNFLSLNGYQVVDVREPGEFEEGHFEGAINIPLHSLRNRINEIPKDREIAVYCAAGLRSYVATRILKQHGYSVKNISGGMNTFRTFPQNGQ